MKLKLSVSIFVQTHGHASDRSSFLPQLDHSLSLQMNILILSRKVSHISKNLILLIFLCSFAGIAFAASSQPPVEFDLDSWNEEIALSPEQHWIIFFYSPTCQHCKRFFPTWDKLPLAVPEALRMAKVDCDGKGQSLCAEVFFPVFWLPHLTL